jgi:hypothetical protein
MAGEAPEYASLDFPEAIKFLRDKINVPSAKWADILGGAHATAFTVAGATKEGMLTDFRAAIDSAIASGTSLGDFQKAFDDIVAKNGWDHTGTRDFRTRVIFSTNLSTAYAAGRHAQMTDPDLLRVMPFWRYRHSDNVKCPRPEHLAWDGLVLRHDDPWWKTHYAPNGWGCQCSVEPLSARELKALGKSGPDTAPPLEPRDVELQTSAGPVTISVPKGIDPGWGYNVGETAQGRKLSEQQMQAWDDAGPDAWESLTPGDWQSAGRARSLPEDVPKAAPAPVPPAHPAATKPALQTAIERAIGGSSAALPTPTGDTINIDAAALAAHLPADAAELVPLLPEIAAEPYEMWLRFERHKGTGKVVLRRRLVKALQLGKLRVMLLLQASGGNLDTLRLLGDQDELDAARIGRLIWSRPAE